MLSILCGADLIFQILLQYLGPVSFHLTSAGNASVGIIGGADGPTAVYMTGPSWKHFPLSCLAPLLMGLTFLAVYFLIKHRNTHK